MTKPYDPNDNDTYVEMYSNNLVQDVHKHMFGDHHTVESRKRAEDNVLHFAKATDLKLVSIKPIKIKTLVPMSLVHRYNLGVDRLSYAQKTPIMFDSKKERFVLLMDRRFARDMDLAQMAGMFDKAVRDSMDVYVDKQGDKHLGILYPTLEALRKDCFEHEGQELRPFDSLHNVYSNYRLSLTQGDKVIVVRFDNASSNGYLMEPSSRDALAAVNASAMRLEFCVAFRFGDRCYLSKDGETFTQKDVMFLKKESAQTKGENDKILRSLGMVKGDLLVLPYSDEQLAFLTAMQSRLESLHDQMKLFFRGCVRKGESLDSPLGPAALPMMQLLLGNDS